MGTERFYRGVFFAAAVYNITWGTIMVLFPDSIFRMAGLPPLDYPFLVSGIGMMVAVYGYGYWVISREPRRYPQLAVLGVMGKAFGAIGWIANVVADVVPAQTLWVPVLNDAIWLPPFIAYLFWFRAQRAKTSLADNRLYSA